MELSFCLILRLVVFSLFLAPIAEAQTSVYGSVALTNFGLLNQGSDTSSDAAGIIGGAFYNFPIRSRLTAGIDGRGGLGLGSGGGEFGAVALRIGFVPEHVVLRPYFQLGGGVISWTKKTPATSGYGFTENTQSNRYTNGAVEIELGFDVRLSESFDVRALELGAVAGASNSYTSVGTGFVGAGLVYHLHKRPHRS